MKDKNIIDQFINFKFDTTPLNLSFFPRFADLNSDLDRIYDLQSLFIPAARQLNNDDNHIPSRFKNEAINYISDLLTLFKELQQLVLNVPITDDINKLKEYHESYFIKQYRTIKNRFNSIYDEYLFKNENNVRISIIETVTGILAFSKDTENTYFDNLKNDFDQSISKSKKQITDFLIEAKKTNSTSLTLLNQLQEKSKEIINQKYSEKFSTQAEKHNSISFRWLAVGIASILLFFILIFHSNIYNELPTEEVIDRVAIYNTTNIILKIAIISIQIFLISFSFKQFSVNRHLSTINKHRANAFNSYEFFAAAAGENKESTNTLMLQLAKAIYEQSSTGYLNEKTNVNPGILEITQLIRGTNGGA